MFIQKTYTSRYLKAIRRSKYRNKFISDHSTKYSPLWRKGSTFADSPYDAYIAQLTSEDMRLMRAFAKKVKKLADGFLKAC